MCTAINENQKRHFFGRTLDLERSYGESVVITPRNFQIKFLHEGESKKGYAIIGVAHVSKSLPLYYDAINECGLGIAALNFKGFARYFDALCDKKSIASFELPLWILRGCSNLGEAKEHLSEAVITGDSFDSSLPPTPLHWLIADKTGAITVEQTESGLKIYENRFGVLTNAPDFLFHQLNVANYMSLSAKQPSNNICPQTEVAPYSRGMGAMGLPGDFSSASRFIRAVFAKSHTQECGTGLGEVSRFFHIMGTVSQPLGCAEAEDGKPISTIYTSCADTEKGIYYFTTYKCRRIRGVRMYAHELDSCNLIEFSMDKDEDIEILG